MSSTPAAAPQRSPQRSSPKRLPLQERSQSQANEIPSRLVRDPKNDPENQDILPNTPFPTKPAHVLLPSTVRKQNSSQNLDIFGPSSGASLRSEPQNASGNGRKPAVRLKRSVKTLRDMYEAQAEESSRPSTAASPALRPSTANSRLRSASSSEGLAGRYAWEQFNRVTSDDLALLPSLPEAIMTLRQIDPKSSFVSRAGNSAAASSPNYQVLDATSSPRIPVYHDLSSPLLEASDPTATSPSAVFDSSSSPNVVRLGQSSSLDDLPSTELDTEVESSSPNVIKLGTSSPVRTLREVHTSSPVQRSISSSSSESRKRKRSDADEGRSFAARAGVHDSFPSSPPYRPAQDKAASPSAFHLRSSPSKSVELERSDVEDSSSVVRVFGSDEFNSSQGSVADTHSNLQAVLSSSPTPPIQYPVVRAPASNQMAGLVIPKRKYRTTDSLAARYTSRLSAVPSVGSIDKSKLTSKRSSFVEDLDDFRDSDSLNPPQGYLLHASANNSQARIVPDQDRHEGEDEVSALPGSEYAYRSPPLRPVRNNSYFTLTNSSGSRLNSVRNSMDTRLNSMKSYTHSRQNSLRSYRPDSAGSMMETSVVPTWARRYYSGFYNDSFQYLYGSTANVAGAASSTPPAVTVRPDTAKSRSSRPSFASLRTSISEHIPAIFRPKNRPRLDARKSHIMPGVGPLVSNPIRAPAAVLQSPRQSQLNVRPTIRPVSITLDPRAHWGGATEEDEGFVDDERFQQRAIRPRLSTSSDILANHSQQSVIWHGQQPTQILRTRGVSPHLHHDHRLNTGSTLSRGYGFPFNRRSRWGAPSLLDVPRADGSKTVLNRRTALIGCFLSGFLLAPMWFVGAILPLPKRPEMCQDVEKAFRSTTQTDNGSSLEISEWEQMDVITKLRLEKQIHGAEEVEWQNARWWRTLNRWMCIVGVLILMIIIILAVLGTRANW